MGRAQIVSGGPDGRYTILVDVGESRRDQLVIAAQQNVDQVTAALATAEVRYAAYQSETEALRVVAEADVQAYVDAIAAHGPTSTQAGEAFLKVLKSGSALEGSRSKEFPERANRDHLRIVLKEAQSRLSRWQSLVLSDTRQAWCADLTESAFGTVATLEVNGESDLILLKPGAPAPTAADGALLSRELLSPEQSFFNAGILPGWQKYNPTFRRGTLTAINSNNHTGTVALADATSSAQRLNVNQATNLTNVPITYMTCHSAAFEVGDQVVVSFDGQAWGSPRVIGFVTDPRSCVSYNLAGGSVADMRLLPDSRYIILQLEFYPSSPDHFASIVSSASYGGMSVFYRRNRGAVNEMFNYNPEPLASGSALFLDQGSALVDQGESFGVRLITPASGNSVLAPSATVFVVSRDAVKFPGRDIVSPGDEVEFIAVVDGKVVFTCALLFSLSSPSLCNMSGTILDSVETDFVSIYDPTPAGGPTVSLIESPGSVAKFAYPLRREGSAYP